LSTRESNPVGVSAPATAWAGEQPVSGVNHGRRLLRAESAWAEFLGYQTIARGRLDEQLCAAWGTPAAAGRPWCLMQPASGANCHIRFIGGGETGGYGPPASWGWNATELLASDPDRLARTLSDSPFRILGGPGNLYAHPKSPRAMQARGPSGELVYFTRILPGGSRYGMKGARSPVDRAFIVTVGGPSLEIMQQFYGGMLGQRVMDRMPFLNGILADACGVARSTIFPTSVAIIPGRSHLVEMDEYPAHTKPRQCRPGQLPDGMAMVGFRVANLNIPGLPLRAPPQRIELPPYAGRRVAVIEGAAGEWLELIEGDA